MEDSTSPNCLSPSFDASPLVKARSSFRPKPYDFTPAISSSCSPIVKSFNKTVANDLTKYSDLSIRKTAIDWRLVKKEAEAIRLRTENQRLQALIRVNNEELEKCMIEHKKQLDEAHHKALALQNKTADLEDQINELKNNLSILNIEKTRSEESLRQEIEFNENKLTESQINDVKMRSQIVDLEEEIKRINLKNDQNNIELKHELQTLKIELEAAVKEKELYLSAVNEYKNKIQMISQLETKINELELKNRSLENTIRDFKDGKSMSFILENELQELEKLRLENRNLVEENKQMKAKIESMTNVIDGLTHQASTSGHRPHKITKQQTEIYVEELTNGSVPDPNSNDNLIQVEFDDEVSVSESMNNSELEIEQADEMEPNDSFDQGRPPQRRGRTNDDQEESIHSASDGESDVDQHQVVTQPNEMISSNKRIINDRISSDEESNHNEGESDESEDDEDEDEGESGEDSDDSDIQEIND